MCKMDIKLKLLVMNVYCKSVYKTFIFIAYCGAYKILEIPQKRPTAEISVTFKVTHNERGA